MKRSPVLVAVLDYLQQSDALPSPQLRRLGLIYSSYRLVVSLFFILMSMVSAKSSDELLLPSLLQQTALVFYVIISVILFALFFVVTKHPRRQLIFGLALDVVILSLLLYTSGAPDLQLTMLYMVVVAASFMLLHGPQALVITLLAIIFVIYQQFFYAIANSMSINNLADALLISVSFLAVGFLSWSVSQRLVHVEQMAAQQAAEVERLNAINQEVISQMISGVMVINNSRVVMANKAAYQLLNIPAFDNQQSSLPEELLKLNPKSRLPWLSQRQHLLLTKPDAIRYFEDQISHQHPTLLVSCLAVNSGQSRSFIYELTARHDSIMDKLRVQIIPLKNQSQLVLLEDLRREQASAQQLKLASLGQLTASIAHEIRNPLAAISQASQLLIEDVDEFSNAGDGELYQMIFDQTKRVNRIIEDVLKLSRQEAPNQQTINLPHWLDDFLKNYFSGQQVRLQAKPCPNVLFDTNHLEQILINLINNGLRYSAQVQSSAAVNIDVYPHENDVIIDVIDDGLGVPSHQLDQLFNPFFTTDKAGTGLGLYLSQAFSGANHARLLYASDHPKTCFRLIVPKAQVK